MKKLLMIIKYGIFFITIATTITQILIMNSFLDVAYSVSNDERKVYDTLEVSIGEVAMNLNTYLANSIFILVCLLFYGIISIVISQKYKG